MPDTASASLRPAPPEFYERLQRLITEHPEQFGHLQEARFEIEVRDTSLVGKGINAWAQVTAAVSDTDRAQYDFKLWFAQDAWAELDEYGRDALCFHELKHCGFDDGKPLLIQHDIEAFDDEIMEYGFWWGEDAFESFAAFENMPAPHGLEGTGEMPLTYAGFRRPMRGGNHGSTGAGGNHGSTGAGGNHGSTGAGGNHGSTGAKVAWSDPGIAGGDFFTVPVGNGEVIELCPDCFAMAAESIFGDLLALSLGDPAQQGGNHGSTGA